MATPFTRLSNSIDDAAAAAAAAPAAPAVEVIERIISLCYEEYINHA
jgi:hypothetical protein